MTESLKNYAKIIGVNFGENIQLDFIVFKGYNEKLPPNFKYEVNDNIIEYKNILTGEVFKIHPNYRKYRSIINNFKSHSKQSEDLFHVVDLMSSLNMGQKQTDVRTECKDFLKQLNHSVLEKENVKEMLNKEIKTLDNKFKEDMNELDKDLQMYYDVQEENMIEFAKLWERYRDMNECKKEAKLMYQAAGNKICQIKKEISNLITKESIQKSSEISRFKSRFCESSLDDLTDDDLESDESGDHWSFRSSDDENHLLPRTIPDKDLEELVTKMCSAIPSTKVTHDLIASYDLK